MQGTVLAERTCLPLAPKPPSWRQGQALFTPSGQMREREGATLVTSAHGARPPRTGPEFPLGGILVVSGLDGVCGDAHSSKTEQQMGSITDPRTGGTLVAAGTRTFVLSASLSPGLASRGSGHISAPLSLSSPGPLMRPPSSACVSLCSCCGLEPSGCSSTSPGPWGPRLLRHPGVVN